MRKSYGGYGRPVHTSKRKKSSVASSVAMVAACILVFIAGVVLGKLPQLTQRGGNAAESSSGFVSSEGQTQDNSQKWESLSLVKPEGEQQLEGLSTIPLEELNCTGYIVIDRITGEVLLEKNMDGKTFPGSTTKILTAALSMEMVEDRNTQMEVSSYALSILSGDATTMGLKRGELMSYQDLMYGMMLPSACDAANVIAENASGGDYNGFVRSMNDKAKEIGCTGTYFVNPSGLYSSSHFSTVADLARIEAYADQKEWYRQIVSTQKYSLGATNIHTQEGWNIIENSNQLLGSDSVFSSTGNIIEIEGSKTGTTIQGGYSMVGTAVTKDGVELIAVVSGIPYNNGEGRYQRIPYMMSLLEEGAKAASERERNEIVAVGELKGAVAEDIAGLLPENTRVVTKRGFSTVEGTEDTTALANGETPVFYQGDETFQTEAFYYENIAELISQRVPGEEVEIGYLTVTSQDGVALTDHIPLYAQDDIPVAGE